MSEGLRAQRLIALFVAGVLLLDFPLLSLWERPATLLGVPLLAAALFIVWALLIALLGWIVERGGSDDSSSAGGG